MSSSPQFLFQIAYDGAPVLDPGFQVLDNRSNDRPDWYEYWPIRRFLLRETLDENAFYGFFSPRFKQKTNLGAAAVREIVGVQGDDVEVVLFSPSLHLTAYHWNVFQYGERVHPGLLAVATEFFARAGVPTDLGALVTHSRNEVYSNYFVAKPRFWRAWLTLADQLFAIAESADDPLGVELRKATSYRGRHDAPMKIFVLERLATWLLARRRPMPAHAALDGQGPVAARPAEDGNEFVCYAHDPFVARSRAYKLPGAVACDALKIAYQDTGRGEYRDVFRWLSGSAKFVGWGFRLGYVVGPASVRTCLRALSSRWNEVGRR